MQYKEDTCLLCDSHKQNDRKAVIDMAIYKIWWQLIKKYVIWLQRDQKSLSIQ